ncbi:hypothetical protein GCM10023350_10850 [Nocardioides endophyticus]|uniref:DUF1707 domain-containing protein n=1 Tax=Nocardioides endophyticus TaxID=1353775 RepID=A0ABP8YJC5_9ACTN
MDKEFWSSFSHDPRDEQYRSMRASDLDRGVVQQTLTEAYADGRLDREEFDERTEQATGSRTLGELVPIVGDLVAATSHGAVPTRRSDMELLARRHWERKRREAAFSFLGASLITSLIWFATAWGKDGFDPYFFWPAFVIAFSLMNLIRTAASRQDIIDSEIRRLEKKRAKELGQPWSPNDKAAE